LFVILAVVAEQAVWDIRDAVDRNLAAPIPVSQLRHPMAEREKYPQLRVLQFSMPVEEVDPRVASIRPQRTTITTQQAAASAALESVGMEVPSMELMDFQVPLIPAVAVEVAAIVKQI
jgi:hypothetical protein